MAKEKTFESFMKSSEIGNQKPKKSLDDFLAHYGRLGQKWGILNAESKARVSRGKTKRKKAVIVDDTSDISNKQSSETKKTEIISRASKMSDSELVAAITRLENERKFANLTAAQPKMVTPPKPDGFIKGIIKQSGKQILVNVATDVGSEYLKKYTKVNINKKLPEIYRIAEGSAKKK